jgi:hypothetical protein
MITAFTFLIIGMLVAYFAAPLPCLLWGNSR